MDGLKVEMFSRTISLIGTDAFSKLHSSHVAVFGVGGVGGYVVEALVRSGVGEITVIDNDTVSKSNINRQIIALHSTIGRNKVDVIKERAVDINPNVKINAVKTFFLPETACEFDFSKYDYVVDAVDTVTAKIKIIECAKAAGVPVISSMGTGNHLDASKFQIADISKTSVCPLSRVMRRELKSRGIKNVKVLFSTEMPVEKKCAAGEADGVDELHEDGEAGKSNGKVTPASIAFVPPVAGLLIAGEVVRELIK